MDFVFANALHYLGFSAMFAALILEMNLFRPAVDGMTARRLALADAAYGMGAVAVLVTGLLRLFLYAKPAAYYGQNFIFHLKITLFVVVILLAIYPSIHFLRNRQAAAGDRVTYPGRIGLLLKLELVLLVIIPFLAVMMGHGYGMMG